MEQVPTGLPELDKLLDAGILRPSCICVSGDFTSNQRNLVVQAIDNFLKKGLKGLYVCLDRPASEVRSQFKRLGFNIDAYSLDYRIFFIDFFTYSQQALIETSTLSTIKYKPNQLLETVSPFLDWIKNGFIIIDSVSTLVVNMDAAEAYDFMRGIKLLGRAFNLITVGIAYLPVAEPKILDLVISNADGNLIFKDDTLIIDHFENYDTKNQMLLISKDDKGRIALKSALVPDQKQETGIDILAFLANVGSLRILPSLSLTASTPIAGSTEELLETIDEMVENKTIKRTPYCSSVSCTRCGSQSVEFYLECPECQSRLLQKGNVIEHFSCGRVDFESNFKDDRGLLVCSKCGKELKQIGVDYRRAGTGFSCANKHLFSNPKVALVCQACREKFYLNDATLENQFEYELTEQGKRQATKEGY